MLYSILYILKKNGVPAENILKISEELNTKRTEHSTFGSAQQLHLETKINNNLVLKRKLVQMFYFDYVLFGFDIFE